MRHDGTEISTSFARPFGQTIFVMIAMVMTVIMTAPTTSAATTSLRVDDDDLVTKGMKRLEDLDYEGALTAFQDAQIENPDAPEIHYDIGITLYRLERWDDAKKAFENAAYSGKDEIERRSALQLGNCAVKQGKFKEALEWYEKALEIDENYEDARINRAWVVRKIKEAARKEKERQEREKKERQVIEKLQELIAKQTAAHLQTRGLMKIRGEEVAPTAVENLRDPLDRVLEQELEAEPPTAEQLVEVFAQLGQAQEKLMSDAQALLDEVRARIEAAKNPPAVAPGAPGTPGMPPGPHGGAAMQDPEVPKLEKAAPHLTAAMTGLEGAEDGARRESFAGLHAGQEQALIDLMRALKELLDELTRIIQDEIDLLKDTDATLRPTDASGQAVTPDPDRLRDRGVELASTQDGLRDRTVAFARGLEGALQALQTEAQQQGATGTSPANGATPEGRADQLRRMQSALGHLSAASIKMENASTALRAPDLKAGRTAEQEALAELLKARQALSPPRDDQGDEKNEKEEKKDENQDGKKDDQKEDDQKDPSDSEQDEKSGQDREPKKLSEEQAKKMLERARQQEKDRRRENKEKGRRVEGRGTTRGRDW